MRSPAFARLLQHAMPPQHVGPVEAPGFVTRAVLALAEFETSENLAARSQAAPTIADHRGVQSPADFPVLVMRRGDGFLYVTPKGKR